MKIYNVLISSADENSGHYVDSISFSKYELAVEFIKKEYDLEQENHPYMFDEDFYECDRIIDDNGNLTGFCCYESCNYGMNHYSMELKETKLN